MVLMMISFRLWEDDGGRRWAKSAKDLQLEMLCVSQFTLYHVMKVIGKAVSYSAIWIVCVLTGKQT